MQQMDGSDESPYDDVWSPALRESLFAASDVAQSWSSEPRQQYNTSPLPRQFHSQPTQSLNHLSAQNQRSNDIRPNSSSSFHPTVSTSINRKRSHLDPPNFPLQSDPVAFNTNSSGRPFNTPTFRSRPTTPLTRGLPRPATPESEDFFASGSSSRRSDTPWPDPEDYSEFVDLTADSSPPNMPPARRTSRNLRDSSSAPSNPAKRRKTEASQSSVRSREIEEVDLRDVDEDNRLSKVLEQQRMATIRAQQEQANRPVKLSTLQCIICMESMTDLTATHCGESLLY